MVYCGFTYSVWALMGIMHSILPTGKPVREMSRPVVTFCSSSLDSPLIFGSFMPLLTQFRLELQVMNKIMAASKLKEASEIPIE